MSWMYSLQNADNKLYNKKSNLFTSNPKTQGKFRTLFPASNTKYYYYLYTFLIKKRQKFLMIYFVIQYF